MRTLLLLLITGLSGCGHEESATVGRDETDMDRAHAIGDGGACGTPIAMTKKPRGPGGPQSVFTEADLNQPCAWLDGGPGDHDHHDTVFMLDGYLVLPWAPEWGGGGLSVFEFNRPCSPVRVATVENANTREVHVAGISLRGGRFLAVSSLVGVQFWDVTDLRQPRFVRDFALPGVTYPDGYDHVTFGMFWQAPYLYVAGALNGLFIVDATDPAEPRLVKSYLPNPAFRLGLVQVVGNLLVALSVSGSRTALLDVSDPADPRPIPGGSFVVHDDAGTVQDAYAAHVQGNRIYYARKSDVGGLMIYDIADPMTPRLLASLVAPAGTAGGYAYVKEGIAVVGQSTLAETIDVSDPTAPRPLAQFRIQGDNDFAVPVGNVVVVSVDDDAAPHHASGVIPVATEVDHRGPEVAMVVPRDGAAGEARSSRVGVGFNELVDVTSVGADSFVVRKQGSGAALRGTYSGQEDVVNFWPEQPLEPRTTYEVIVPAGGITDPNGNPAACEFRSTFTTGDR